MTDWRTRVCVYFAADLLGVDVGRLMLHPTFDSRDYTVWRGLIGRP